MTGRTGVPVERWDSSSSSGGIVLISQQEGVDPAARTWAERFVREGFVVVAPAMGWRGELADGPAIADLAACRDLLPAGRPRFVVGMGAGGLYARMAACAVLGWTGAVDAGGRIQYAGVCAQRPIQPLDLLPGLGCALQCHFAENDIATPPTHVDELEHRLASMARPWQVLRYPGRDAGFLDPAGPSWHPADAEAVFARTRAFLLHLAAFAG